MLVHFGIAFAFFIAIAAIRQAVEPRWINGVYWSNMTLLGFAIQYSFPFEFLPVILIPVLLRRQFLGWLEVNRRDRTIPFQLASVCIMAMIVEWTSYGMYVVGIYLVVELILMIRLVLRKYRQKGISRDSNVGIKVNTMNVYLLLNLFLVALAFTGYFNFFEGTLPLTLVYLALGLSGIWMNTGPAKSSFTIRGEGKYAKSALDPKEKYRILTEVDRIFSQGSFHKDPNASLPALAKAVKSNTHQVSQVINESKGMTFFELLAYHRVQEGKKLLRNSEYKNFKIEGIAEQVGYLSKSAFNTSFKKFTGKTPSEFRDSDVRDHKVERRKRREIDSSIEEEGTFGYIKNSMVMFSNFFKIYFRTLWRNKAFSFINIFGLVVGLTSSLLIYVYLQHELSYDSFHDQAEDIYRVSYFSDNPQTRTPHPMAQAMVRDFPQVVAATSLSPMYGPGLTLQSIYIRNPETNVMFAEPDGFNADSTFFDVFDFKLIKGNEREALREVGGLVITESLAKKYFGEEDPMGKRLEAPSYNVTLVVTGVMEDPPTNSHFHPRFINSYVTLKSANPDDPWFGWGDAGHFNYIKLQPGTDPLMIENAIPDWLAKYNILDEQTLQLFRDRIVYLGLQRITDIHLTSHIKWELEANSNMMYIYILGAAIAFLLVIASINFVNLSTARAFERAKEVGIRKTLGANAGGVSVQFVSEAIATSVISTFIAFGFAGVLFQRFVALTGQKISIAALFGLDVMAGALTLALLIGIFTGIYPALAIRRIKPSEILKGKFINQSGGSTLRKGLVVVQFIVSAMMIFGSAIILKQVKFMENKALGFDEDQLIVLKLHSGEQRTRIQAIKNELGSIAGVRGVAAVSNVPGGQFNQNAIFVREDPTNAVSCSELRVDFEALQLLGVDLVEGRWFDRSMSVDSSGASYIVNQAALKQLNLDDPFGTTIVWDEEWGEREGRIIGVIDDFHYKSLHESIKPMVINVLPRLNYVMIKVDGQRLKETLAQIEEVHAEFDPVFEFTYSFLDEEIGELYRAERQAFDVFNLFTVIALILASMGLLGLSYLVITQRTREIGIRKVMGARILDILWMENKSFLKATLLAVVIGIPLAWWIMKGWISGFAYQAPIGLLPFLFTVVIVLAVSIGSVTFAVLRTVLRNPSNALRYE